MRGGRVVETPADVRLGYETRIQLTSLSSCPSPLRGSAEKCIHELQGGAKTLLLENPLELFHRGGLGPTSLRSDS